MPGSWWCKMLVVDDDLEKRTIQDFGEQWLAYQENVGYYGSVELLVDIVGSVVDPAIFRGARVGDVGSGTGRIVQMLLDAGAASVVAVEPSAAADVLARAFEGDARVELVRARGVDLPADRQLDVVTSIGVLHHIPEPAPTVAAMHASLRPGGTACVWLYGKEGNRGYLALAMPMRAVTRQLPHRILQLVAAALEVLVRPYAALARRVAVPGSGYLRRVYGKLDVAQRRLIAYDQLNPAYARYYTQAEARALLEDAGFRDLRVHHRHGYSWAVAGTKPADS